MRLILISVVILFFSCSKVPLTNRKQMNLIPEQELVSMSLTSYSDFLKQHPPAPESDSNSRMVKRVGGRISSAVTHYMNQHGYGSRLKDYKWEFNLVKSNEVNAWCMPGGKVVVYSGLLPVTRDEAGLAFVMGHEVAHAVARHGNERMSQMLLAETGSIALDVALMNKPAQTRELFQTAYGVGATIGAILPFSRLHESEADDLGLIFMALAGYDPSVAPQVWERMIALNKGEKPPEFLSTHPSDENRIAAIRKQVPVAMKYYRKKP
jgi:predicted Zn-dependent protease